MKSELEYLKIGNLRSLSMDDAVNLAPITILIGKNSAGKSTFARFFPLIRQSCEAKKRAPILWFGDRVDFGSFEESVCKSAGQNSEISFTFGMKIEQERARNIFRLDATTTPNISYQAKISLSVKKSPNRPSQASRISIEALGFSIDIKLTDQDTIEHIRCGDVVWQPSADNMTRLTYSSILPSINFYTTGPSEKPGFKRLLPSVPFKQEIEKKLSRSKVEEYGEFVIDQILAAPPLPRNSLADYILERTPFKGIKSKSSAKEFTKICSEIEEMATVARINSFLEIYDSAVSDHFSGVKYIEPLRATAQRYYRKQELAVDEIDSRGENLAMFLDSIQGLRLREFNDWTMKNFGFSARTENQGGHVTIVIKENGTNTESNLADIGFGFSQILPVITQIWVSNTKNYFNAKRTTCIVVEQPELHLHPSFQAKLADMFAAAMGSESKQRFVIETHSSSIVNRFGQLINSGKLKNSDVQILIFEKNDESKTKIKIAGYNEKGYLTNWPIGFFEPGVD